MDTINKIGIAGAGMMGAEIALSFALNGAEVVLKDKDLEISIAGRDRINRILSKWADRGKIGREEVDNTMKLIVPTEKYSGFKDVELVIEAAFEDFEIKCQVFNELEDVCTDNCIFATNTSSIPITQLAGRTLRPDRFIGVHFFSPASVMKLVEVIPGIETSQDTIKKVLKIITEIKKEPVRVLDRAGFLVNRLLFAFFNEAWRMINEGAAVPEDIDKAVKLGLGHPVGIFQMQDLVGLDNALAVSDILYEEYGERFRPSPVLKRKVAAGHIGKKVKKGWFDYDE